jgi:hypothetical protein
MSEYLGTYLKWMNKILSNPISTIQSKIIIYDTIKIFYKDEERSILSRLNKKTLLENEDKLENVSKFYLLIFSLLTNNPKVEVIIKNWINSQKEMRHEIIFPFCYLEKYEEQNVQLKSLKDEDLKDLYYISCNKKKFNINSTLKEEYFHEIEAKMLLKYNCGEIEKGNKMFRLLINFGDVNNSVINSAYRKLLSKQNPIGFWGVYSRTKFTNKEIESLLNIGFDSLRTLKEYKDPYFCLFNKLRY